MSSALSISQGLRAVAGVDMGVRVLPGLELSDPMAGMQVAMEGGTLSPITSTHSLGKKPT